MHLVLVFFILNTTTGKIQGTVIDEDSSEPIPYANVVVLNTEIGAATDEDGNFYMLNVLPGVYTVEVSCLGYQTKQIEYVVVEINQTARLKVSLKPTAIEILPITITSKRPSVIKDMTGTTYIIKRPELATLPIDYVTHLVAFQPSVAIHDTGLHVRGGRATEVNYMIDNVSIIDPLTGELAINISKGIIDEVIFLPGGFDVEYGRAMSGVINMVTVHPADNLQLKAYAKTETIMPFYYDFGYETYQSSAHLPVSNRIKGFFAMDLMHTDDWNPRLYILPHKQRYDYSFYGKCIINASGKVKLAFSGAKSRSQFDRYDTKWKFHLDHYRSDMRNGDVQIMNINYLPDSRKLLNLTLSRLNTRRIFGVREEDDYGLFKDFRFRDYNTLQWPFTSNKNPYGVSGPVISEGDFYQYQNKISQVYKAHFNTTIQLHKYHECKAGFEYTFQDFENFTYYVSDSLHQLIDGYDYYPKEFALYVQDNIDYEGLYAKVGCRYDYFSAGIKDIKPKINISPRAGFSFMVTEKFLFRTNVGRYTQPPLYSYVYDYYNLLPFPSYIVGMKSLPVVGNPDLRPEQTISYEIGLQGKIRKKLSATFNAFYKDVSNLIGTRPVPDAYGWYVSYFNVEYANVKGLEAIIDFANSVYTGKISYTLSWARGTSSYAEEVYYRYYYQNPDTTFVPETKEYNLDSDQRHRIFVQGVMNFPLRTKLHLFGYFGTGFPYTPPSPEGKTAERNTLRLTFQRRLDCLISKKLRIGPFTLNADVEVINLLDVRYKVLAHFPIIPLGSIKAYNFTSYISFHSSHYSPAADFNHDGLITPREEYTAYVELVKETDDWVNAYTSPRRARIGISVNF
jgi:outer membrane receptor protein involved in Fe transport